MHKKEQSAANDAVRRLAEEYGGMVRTICLAILRGHTQDAQEAMADTFVKLWQNAARLPAEKPLLQSYVARTARNTAIDRYRRLQRQGVSFLLSEDDAEEADFATGLDSLLETRELAQMILSLSPPDGEIFLRHYYYCEPTADIAAHFALPAATVRTKLARTRLKLQAMLTKEDAV